MLWFMTAVSVRRCHDHDKSGWWCPMVLIPVFGIFFLIVFLGFMRGTEDANQYGLPVVPLSASQRRNTTFSQSNGWFSALLQS